MRLLTVNFLLLNICFKFAAFGLKRGHVFFSYLTSVYTLNFCKKVISCHFLIPKRPLCYIVLYQKVEPRKDLSNVYQDTLKSVCFNSHLNSYNPTISQHILLIFFDGLRNFENTITSNHPY